MLHILTSFFLIALCVCFSTVLATDYTAISSCKDVDDGTYIQKLINDESYPYILAQCSNGYTLIDYSVDSEWESYFSSFRKYDYAVGGPQKFDHVNWNDWIQSDVTDFVVSPDCSVCDETADIQYESTLTAYYMTGLCAPPFFLTLTQKKNVFFLKKKCA